MRPTRRDWTTLNDESALCQATARKLADGNIVGWFQGRMEWGARALGNRLLQHQEGIDRLFEMLLVHQDEVADALARLVDRLGRDGATQLDHREGEPGGRRQGVRSHVDVPAPFGVYSDTELRMTVPAGAQTAKIRVTTGAGTSAYIGQCVALDLDHVQPCFGHRAVDELRQRAAAQPDHQHVLRLGDEQQGEGEREGDAAQRVQRTR